MVFKPLTLQSRKTYAAHLTGVILNMATTTQQALAIDGGAKAVPEYSGAEQRRMGTKEFMELADTRGAESPPAPIERYDTGTTGIAEVRDAPCLSLQLRHVGAQHHLRRLRDGAEL